MRRILGAAGTLLVAAALAAASASGQEHAMPAGDASPPPLYTDLGTWTHPITGSKEAQAFFDQGLRLCYGFNHAEAIRAFHEAARLDPNCAMAWWGIAYASGPNFNLPMDEEGGKRAIEAVGRAQALRSLVSAQDRDWIDAIAVRYSADPKTTRAGLDSAWCRAMKALAKKYPKDADAGTIYAESMMDLNPWNQWTDDFKANPGTLDLVTELERVLKMAPAHPGANHYYIHTVEASSRPERAVAAADRLGGLMPGAGHIVHMPAHIYARVARYDDAVKVNRAAVAVDEKYLVEQKQEQGIYGLMYTSHNVHFIWFASCMEGRYEDAIAAARKVAARVPAELITQMPMIELVPPVPVLTLARFGRWDEVLAEPMPNPAWHYATGAFHVARGTAQAAKGNFTAAREELAAVRAIAEAIPADQMVSINYAKPLLRIGVAQLEGEIAAREKRWDDAVSKLTLAVASEDSLHYDEPPTWYMPIRQRLGAALLDAGRAKDAERVFREDLDRHPENGWSLYGLAQALRVQKKERDATAVDARFNRAWQRADVKLAAASY